MKIRVYDGTSNGTVAHEQGCGAIVMAVMAGLAVISFLLYVMVF